MLEDQRKEKVEVLCNARKIENICKSSCHKSKGQNKAMAMIKYSIDTPYAPQYWLSMLAIWSLILGFLLSNTWPWLILLKSLKLASYYRWRWWKSMMEINWIMAHFKQSLMVEISSLKKKKKKKKNYDKKMIKKRWWL